jgi:transposase
MGELLAQLKLRHPNVREVDWSWISQQCSQCGHYDENRYQRGHFRGKERSMCRCPNPKCPSAGELMHVDVNAARNALGRPSISEVAAE